MDYRFGGSARFQFGRCVSLSLCVCVFISVQWKFMFLCGVLMANLLKPAYHHIHTYINVYFLWPRLYIILCAFASLRFLDAWLISALRMISACLHCVAHTNIRKNCCLCATTKATEIHSFFLSPHGTNMKNARKKNKTKRINKFTTDTFNNINATPQKKAAIIKVQIREKFSRDELWPFSFVCALKIESHNSDDRRRRHWRQPTYLDDIQR